MSRQTKLRNLISLSSIILISLLNGCGGGSRNYQETAPAEEGIQTDESLIVTNENGDANITYIELDDGSIYIDCSGGCGDIYIGKEVLEEDYGPDRD